MTHLPEHRPRPVNVRSVEPSEGAHWSSRQRLSGDEGRFLAMVSLIRCHRNLVNVVEDELRPYRLNLTSYLLLTTLRLSPAGTEVIGALARRLCVHASTAALALDRLEARDLVRRDPHPTDRRAICVTVTKSGHRLGRAATDALRFVDFGIPEDPHTITELGQILDVLLASAAGEARRAG